MKEKIGAAQKTGIFSALNIYSRIGKHIAYANYLIAMCYYETIEDEKRDTGPLLKAKKQFEFVSKNYPNTDFAMDAKFKLELIQDILAAKEIYIARHYIKKEKWAAAINRLKNVVTEYDQKNISDNWKRVYR